MSVHGGCLSTQLSVEVGEGLGSSPSFGDCQQAVWMGYNRSGQLPGAEEAKGEQNGTQIQKLLRSIWGPVTPPLCYHVSGFSHLRGSLPHASYSHSLGQGWCSHHSDHLRAGPPGSAHLWDSRTMTVLADWCDRMMLSDQPSDSGGD